MSIARSWPLTMDCVRACPDKGWTISGKSILPPSAYTSELSWIEYLCAEYPDERYREKIKKGLSIIKEERSTAAAYGMLNRAIVNLCRKLNKEQS